MQSNLQYLNLVSLWKEVDSHFLFELLSGRSFLSHLSTECARISRAKPFYINSFSVRILLSAEKNVISSLSCFAGSEKLRVCEMLTRFRSLS